MIKVGDRVRTIGWHEGLEATVTKIVEGRDVEHHGAIYLKIERITVKKNFKWLKVGDTETFVHFEWWKSLEII